MEVMFRASDSCLMLDYVCDVHSKLSIIIIIIIIIFLTLGRYIPEGV